MLALFGPWFETNIPNITVRLVRYPVIATYRSAEGVGGTDVFVAVAVGGTGVIVLVGSAVALAVGTTTVGLGLGTSCVAVGIGVLVGVDAGVLVVVAVGGTGVLVAVAVGGTGVFVGVGVLVGVDVGVLVFVAVAVGGTGVFVGVLVAVAVGGTGVFVGVLVGVGVGGAAFASARSAIRMPLPVLTSKPGSWRSRRLASRRARTCVLVRLRLLLHTSAVSAAAAGAEALVPQNGAKPGTVVTPQSPAVRIGCWSVTPPLARTLPGVSGVPFGW